MNDKQHIKSIASKSDIIELPSNFPGLARSHRLIMIERSKEIQVMKLCAQIHLDDFKKDRADMQRNDRRAKRQNMTNPSF
jgi:hypothetical protein